MIKMFKGLFGKEHQQHEEGEQEDEIQHIIKTNSEIDKLFENVKIKRKEDYLEKWKENYLSRITKVIEFAFQDPDKYNDVVAVLNKFEEFYARFVLALVEMESMKQMVDIYRAKASNKQMGQEFR